MIESLRFYVRYARESFYRWAGDHLPRRIAYYATVRVGAEACVGYPLRETGRVTVIDALRHWEGQITPVDKEWHNGYSVENRAAE